MQTNSFFQNIIITILLLSISGGILMAAPIPSHIKSVVAFIFIENKIGKLVPNGTAFFVGVKNASDPNTFAVYLVTAKHVLCKPKTSIFLDRIFVRLNKKEGGAEIGAVPIKAKGKERNVFTHSDPLVDIAVIEYLPNQEKLDFKFIPDDMITTVEAYKNLKIREGSEVFFTGLFTPHVGVERNYPIVRFGRVAMVTDEKVEWGPGKHMDLYLIEVGSYGGNSGSPVFFALGSDREPGSIMIGPPIYKLAGVMQGTFLDAHEIKVVKTKTTDLALSSMGIAAVVPGYKLHEVLFSEEVKKSRGF